jgi:hypothetical protein
VHGDPEAVLITGVYGSGKTSVVEEIAGFLDEADVSYAAIDLDWLIWANVEGGHGPAARGVLERNLAAVVQNYREAGITRFLLAGYLEDADAVAGIAHAVGMPMKVVRLDVPIEVIEQRIGHGRSEELEVARAALAAGRLDAVGDLALAGDRPVAELATEIRAWLGWMGDAAAPLT